MRLTTPLLTLLLSLSSMMLLTGCPEGGAEEAGEVIDEAVEDAGEAIEDAGDAIDDAVDDHNGTPPGSHHDGTHVDDAVDDAKD
jgi:hypothetical protein